MLTIPLKPGADFEIVVPVYVDGEVRDLTGWSIHSQVRRGATLVADLTATSVDPASGVVTLTATPEQTRTWEAKKHLIDILLVDEEGKTIITPTFVIEVEPRITDAPQ